MSSTEIGERIHIETRVLGAPVSEVPSIGTRTHFEVVASILERLFDVVTVLTVTPLSYYLYGMLPVGRHVRYSTVSVAEFSMLCAIIFMVLLDNSGAYRRANSLMRIRETERILQVGAMIMAIIFPLTFFSARLFSRGMLVMGAVLVPSALILEKQAFFSTILFLHKRDYGIRRVLIYGAGHTGKRVFSVLSRSIKIGLRPVAMIDDSPELDGHRVYGAGYRRQNSARVVRGPLTAELIRRHKASMVIVAIPSLSQEKLDQVTSIASAAGAIIAFVPRTADNSESFGEFADIDGLLIAYRGETSGSQGYEVLKRGFDLVTALLVMCFTAPIWLAISWMIRRDSAGPVLFKQARVGKNGAIFQIYKFRTMYVDAPPYDYHPANANDPRVTNFGRWLRRTSLDELPQLINVLKGEMSLVGPRPEMPFIVESYEERHRQRLKAIPGITGLWQLSADRAFPIHENMHCDLYYIRYRNFFMDIAILLHTILFAMRGI